jgi:hypothetical protein
MENNMALSLRNRFVPKVEHLEDRSLLTVMTFVNNNTHTLTIINNGNLAVVDNGTSGKGNVTVNVPGQAPVAFDSISSIIIMDVGNPDAMAYQLTGNLTGPRRLDVDMGTGNNSFIASLGGSLLANTSMLINVTGHTNRDVIQEAVTGNLFDGSSLTFNVSGSTSSNLITAVVLGSMFGNSRNVFNATGGPGNDFFAGAFLGAMLNGSTTQWNVNLGGGSDTFSGYLTSQLSFGAAFRINFSGSASDLMNVGADNMVVAPGASLSMGLVGGNGPDSISDFFRGVLLGSLAQVAIGGNSNDAIAQTTLLSSGSTTANGGVVAFVEGNGGNDNLFEVLRPSALRAGVNALIDGGSGFNIARRNAPVRVVNCQVVIPV